MTAVRRYVRAATAAEALEAKRADPSAPYLAGGTVLLAGDRRDKPEAVIDIAAALPRGASIEGSELAIGAGTTFQELAVLSPRSLPERTLEAFAKAALTMMNRNTRNRGTIGGNLGADKSCSSLVPLLIALGAEVEVVSPSSTTARRLEIEAWLRSRAESPDLERAADLVVRVMVPIRPELRSAYRRWNRVSCDLSVIGAAVAYELEPSIDGILVRGLRVALGGLGPKARRAPVIEALFEGSPLPSRGEIEAMAAPLLKPIDDLRASAGFKRMRGAQLIADALLEAADGDSGDERGSGGRE